MTFKHFGEDAINKMFSIIKTALNGKVDKEDGKGLSTKDFTGYVQTGKKEGSTVGNFATIEGTDNVASRENAHAEGHSCQATAPMSHAEGTSTSATQPSAHAEGSSSMARGNCSHAEGHSALANGFASHAAGEQTQADGDYQTAIGKFNVPDTVSSFIIGGGADKDNRKSIFKVDWDGNVVCGTINGIDLKTLKEEITQSVIAELNKQSA